MYLDKFVNIVVAATENGVIGHGMDRIEWPEQDQMNFHKLTIGNSVIIGRKTFHSIGKPFVDRQTIVLTKHPERIADSPIEMSDREFFVATSIEGAIGTAEGEIFFFGGQKVYKGALPYADRLHLTRIKGRIAGDKFFRFDENEWQEAIREEHKDFTYFVYERKQ